jgi:excisionase family DNA binding protein
MTANGNGKLLTVTEVADWFDVSTKTVVRWTRNGKLPFVRLPGGRLRYVADEIQIWVEAHHGSEQDA